MPQFSYKAKRGPDDVVTGLLDAESQRAAGARLREMGYFPISIEEHVEEEKKDSLKQALVRIKLNDRNIFFRQLANLIEAGMPITGALATVFEQTTNTKMAEVVEKILDDVRKGGSLAGALEKHPKVFPTICSSVIQAGETGGMLEESLWRLVEFGEQDAELRAKAVAAMIYPAFLMTIGSIAIFILVSFVFPNFIVVFEDFGAELPWPTVLVMAFCGFMGDFWWLVLIVIFIAGVSFRKYAKSEKGKEQLDVLWLRIPAVSAVVQRYEMAKFSRTLGTLFDNGVPMLMSLRITKDTVGNSAIVKEIALIHDRVREGESISESLRDSKFFPPLVINMLAIGEESGRLGAVSKRIADAYDIEVDRAVKALSSLFEPILIVVMGVIVGFLIIAILLPMLTLSGNIS